MFSIHCQDVSWVILLISCWFVGWSWNTTVNWFSMFKCREQHGGPGPHSAQRPTLRSEHSHKTSLSIIGQSISMSRSSGTTEIRGGQSIAGCCHLLARCHMSRTSSYYRVSWVFYVKLHTSSAIIYTTSDTEAKELSAIYISSLKSHIAA